MARPTDYNEEIAAVILERISGGESVNAIFKDEAMPNPSTFYLWRVKHTEFSDKCAHAIEQRAINISREMIDIADEVPAGSDNAEIQRQKLRIDARDKYLSRMAPRKHEISGPNKGPIQTSDISAKEVLSAFLASKSG